MVIAIIMVIVGGRLVPQPAVAQYPNIVPPEIAINATFVGGDAITVEHSVATPIEQQLSGVDHMNYMYSLNASNGSMKETVNFDVTTDPNTDQYSLKMRVLQAQSQLPSSVQNYGVTVAKSTSAPLMVISLYSPTGQFDSSSWPIILHQFERPDSSVPGIGSVSVLRSGQYALRIWVDPNKLARSTSQLRKSKGNQRPEYGEFRPARWAANRYQLDSLLPIRFGPRTPRNRGAVREHCQYGRVRTLLCADQRCWRVELGGSDLLPD